MNHHSATVLPPAVTETIFQHVEKLRFPKIERGHYVDVRAMTKAASAGPMIVANHIQRGLEAFQGKSLCQFFYPHGMFQPLAEVVPEPRAVALVKTLRAEEMNQFYSTIAKNRLSGCLIVTLFCSNTTHQIKIFPAEQRIVDPTVGTIQFATEREFDTDLIRLLDAYRNWFGSLRGVVIER